MNSGNSSNVSYRENRQGEGTDKSGYKLTSFYIAWLKIGLKNHKQLVLNKI